MNSDKSVIPDRKSIFNLDDYSTIKCAGCERELKVWNLCTSCLEWLNKGNTLKSRTAREKQSTSLSFEDVKDK